MREKRLFFTLFLMILLLLPAVFSGAQESRQAQFARRFNNGTQFYALSRWQEATTEFRRAQEAAATLDEWSHALYWVILSELAHSDYGSALRDMQELDKYAPNSNYSRDMVYHKARVYYNQGYFEDALILFNRFASSIRDTNRESSDRRAASFFWIGECLFSTGYYDDAEKFYAWVIARYPESPKNEAAVYRIDLINQKKIEAELLALLQWSHEESLRTSEDYQRKIRTYEHTLNQYQRRIAELTQDGSINHIEEPPPPPEIFTESAVQPKRIEPLFEEPVIPPDIFSNDAQSQEDKLLERARQLERDLHRLLNE